MNVLDKMSSFSMEWIEFGKDISAMSIVAGIAVIGVAHFSFPKDTLNNLLKMLAGKFSQLKI
ncbi:MAG: hypothetical protein VYC17_02140 [Nitrospinota bacterium]|nr:hypothetical protein [Nitrospinota bacterium]